MVAYIVYENNVKYAMSVYVAYIKSSRLTTKL